MSVKKEDMARFPGGAVELRNGARALIRHLGPDDGEALAAFYESLPDEDYFFYCPHPLMRQHAMEKAAHAHSPNFVCLALEAEDGSIAGYAWYQWQNEGSQKSTFGICIRRDFQGQGAGRALMTRINEIAREIGPRVMALTVQKANPVAIELYKKMGFHIAREQFRESDHEPEYCMERETR